MSACSRWVGGLILAVLCGLAPLSGCGGDPESEPLPPPVERGSTRVAWGFETPDGAAVDCADRRIASVEVSLGGAPKAAGCGDVPALVFEDLIPGRYPVLITVLGPNGVRLYEHVGNVAVQAGPITDYAHTFVVDETRFGEGRIDVRWLIDGLLPSRSCGLTGAANARIRISEGPGAARDLDAACADAGLVLEGVRQGTWRVQVDLSDASGELVGFPAVDRSVLVVQNETTEVILDVITRLPERGTLRGIWSIDGVDAPDGCAAVPEANRVEVAVRTDDAQSVTIATATAACAAVAVELDDLPVGRTIDGVGLRATFRLFDRTLGSQLLDTQVVRDIVLQPARTGTVSVDFFR